MEKHFRVSTVIDGVRKQLIFHYLRMYVRILSSCLDTFGFGIWFLYYLIKIPAKVIYINISLFLDNIFFPKYRRVKIEKPIFIIAHPRSGTTFLHAILTQTGDYLLFTEWDIANPSLTIRKLFGRSKALQGLLSAVFDFRLTPHKFKRLIKGAKGKSKKEEIDGTGQSIKQRLGFIAQEEEPIFLNILDTQFLPVVTPIGFSKEGYPEVCFNDEQPHQEKSVLFLKNCFKRQIYYTGKKQIIAKMPYSLFRIKTLLKFFPDAKIIYIARSPLETIPSHSSLHHRRLNKNFGLDNIPDDKLQQYFRHRYEYDVLLYKYFDNLISNNEIPKDQILEITYNSIKNELWNVLQQIKSFANLQFSPELEERLKRQDKEQSSYKRKHKNLSLEAFGLTEEKIRSDLNFVFKRYGF